MKARREPERAWQEHAFATGQTVDVVYLGAITQDKTFPHQFALDRFDRTHDALVLDREKSTERHHQQARVQFVRDIKLRKRFFLRGITALAHLAMKLVAELAPALHMCFGGATAFLAHL